MPVRIPNNSRLNMAELVTMEGFEFWDTVVLPDVPTSDADVTYVVQAGDRLDLIAYRFYGDPVLWWYVAVANGMELLPTELNLGRVLRIPPANYLSTYIGSVRGL